jgi:CLIP-associating protein 1/2
MSSSAVVAIRFIIQHTHASRLIPIITYNISSKSKEIRKACSEFLDQLLHTWPNHAIEKHVGILQEAIKKGISDADAEARAYARKAFWGFADKFKQEADYLLNSLDSSKQRILHEQNNISNWSSTNSLNKAGYYQRPQSLRTNSVSSSGSIENINRQSANLTSKARSGIPIFSPRNELGLCSSITSNLNIIKARLALFCLFKACFIIFDLNSVCTCGHSLPF